jgi:predicted HicB family RNase H-like nuclease
MKNMMVISGQRAVVQYDPEIELFRGEFVGLNGSADFYADSVDGLRREGEISLRVFMETCAEKGISPFRAFSGKFQVRASSELHRLAVAAAAASGVSLNQLVVNAVQSELGEVFDSDMNAEVEAAATSLKKAHIVNREKDPVKEA